MMDPGPAYMALLTASYLHASLLQACAAVERIAM